MKTKRLVRVDSNIPDGEGVYLPLYKLDGEGRDCEIRYREGDLFYYEKGFYGACDTSTRRRKYGGRIISENENESIFEPMSVRKK